jgi:PKHD-type hydroxylase
MLKHFYSYTPKAIPKELCEYIIQTTPWDKRFDAQLSDDNVDLFVDDGVRKTDVVFLNPLTTIGCILQSYIKTANTVADWNFDISKIEDVQVGCYQPGGHYDWHIDSFVPNNDRQQRKISAIAFLSDPDAYDGGVFELEVAPDIPERIPQGSIIVFPSVLKHRVTAVEDGVRFSAACWASGPAFR